MGFMSCVSIRVEFVICDGSVAVLLFFSGRYCPYQW